MALIRSSAGSARSAAHRSVRYAGVSAAATTTSRGSPAVAALTSSNRVTSPRCVRMRWARRVEVWLDSGIEAR
ncbi:hypothetical protein ABZ815_24660 [Nonomuraea sp. NPDC047529]|uniref:hypothetical protein n=1 Tax=Nonomuraea sp. NPDC047529 TaxID=3155623 RepID=UPI0033FF7E54